METLKANGMTPEMLRIHILHFDRLFLHTDCFVFFRLSKKAKEQHGLLIFCKIIIFLCCCLLQTFLSYFSIVHNEPFAVEILFCTFCYFVFFEEFPVSPFHDFLRLPVNQVVLNMQRSPCPYRITDDTGSGFIIGSY